MGDITENFSLKEFKASNAYPDLAREIDFTEMDQYKLYFLCATLLQPVRDKYGPVHINSGKRSLELNQKIGGSPTSDHLFLWHSCACDFWNKRLLDAFHFVRQHYPDAFGQMILYFRWKGNPKHIHISLPTPKHHGEILIKHPGRKYERP